jgi:hypothetical protein
MGASLKIAVEAGCEAKWLIERLSEEGFESVDFVRDPVDLHCTFRCLTNDESGNDAVARLLKQWPEVNLQLNPEYSSGQSKLEVSPHLSRKSLNTPAHSDTVVDDLEAFRVWVRPLGNAWKVRVQDANSGHWLRNELTHRGLTCSDASPVSGTSMQTFRCMSETPHEAFYVWNLLKALPQVLLQNDPA